MADAMPSTTFQDERTLDGRAVRIAATVAVDDRDSVADVSDEATILDERPTPAAQANASPDSGRIPAGQSEDLLLPDAGVFAWIGEDHGSRMIRLYQANADNPYFTAAIRQCLCQDANQFGQLLAEATSDPDRLEQILTLAATYQPQPEEIELSLDLHIGGREVNVLNTRPNGHATLHREPLRVTVTGPGTR